RRVQIHDRRPKSARSWRSIRIEESPPLAARNIAARADRPDPPSMRLSADAEWRAENDAGSTRARGDERWLSRAGVEARADQLHGGACIHSHRRATTGSTRDARCAGRNAAAKAITSSRTIDVASAIGS